MNCDSNFYVSVFVLGRTGFYDLVLTHYLDGICKGDGSDEAAIKF